MRQLLMSVLTGLAFLMSSGAYAQPLEDVIPRDLYTDELRQNGNSITFCYNPDGMMAEFEAELADIIGSVLLVNVEINPLDGSLIPTKPLDYRLPFLPEQIFLLLAEECDAIIGYVLSRSVPEWVLLTRPYLSTPSMLIVKDTAINTIEDVPLDQVIGSRSLALSDNRLSSFIRARPEDRRWKRTPYYDNRKLLDRLDDGTVSAAVIWAPALYYATDGDPEAAGYHALPLPFPDNRTQFGIATRSNNTYLNSILGDAIAELVNDGTIAEMSERHNLGPDNLPE